MIKSRATSQTKLREQVQILHLIVGRLIYEANYHPRIQVVSDVDTMSIPFRPRVIHTISRLLCRVNPFVAWVLE